MADPASTEPEAPTAEPAEPTAQPLDVDNLDAIMEAAKNAANAMAEQGIDPTAQTTDPAPETISTPDPQPGETPPREPAPEDDEDSEAPEPSGQEPSEPDTSSSEPTDPTARKPSRREAARLAEQLTAAETAKRLAEAQLATVHAEQKRIIERFSEMAGTDEEFEQARLRAENGDQTAKARADVMRNARSFIPVLYQQAERVVLGQLQADFNALRSLPDMTEDGHAQLMQARTPTEMARRAYSLGQQVSDEKAEARVTELQEQHKVAIDKLETQVRELKTRNAATGAQPAAGGGTTGKPNVLANLMKTDPLTGALVPTDEAEAYVRRSGVLALPA